MTFSIGAAAKMTGVPASTIRYYEREGLLPSLGRSEGGQRTFEPEDIEALEMIGCLKMSGMPIRDIALFMERCSEGDETLRERLEMFLERRTAVRQQMTELQQTLDIIEYKCWYYQTAMDAGTEQAVRIMPLEQIPENMAKLKQTYFPDPKKERGKEGAA